MASSSALPNQPAVQAYCRQEKRARIAWVASLPQGRCGSSAADPNWRDWVNLTAGPAGLIGERVLEKNIVGYLRFRAVCKSWRRCTASQHANGGLEHRFHPRRWIMLSRTSGSLRRRHDFLNVSTGQRIQVDIPKIRYQHVFGATFEGLLVLCHKRTYAVRLLNSLTRNECSLEYLRVSGAGLAGGSSVALHLGTCSLYIAKPGDDRWTSLPVDHRGNNAIIATLSFNIRFYYVTEKAVMVVDTTVGQPLQMVMVAGLSNWDFKRYDPRVKLV
ncbi:hypothetical protein ZWY2020_024183 [Hordeum vulgare]|nr:hypothetical protein ZWY2020_006982 [Hordeum vulgare]KAI5012049.1 hypothetical protein ZWY2020_024183 [Hordeum vulgare]